MKFQPVSHSWIALNPEARGVIKFVGGAFFGTFGPSIFYQYILKYFYDRGFTIVVLPFKFTFNHYAEAGFLISEQYEILPEMIRMAQAEEYEYSAYLDENNFYWLGHSIGCKYITLLEGFSALPSTPQERQQFIEKLLVNSRTQENIAKVVSQIENLIESLQVQVSVAKKLIVGYTSQEISLGNSRLDSGEYLPNNYISWLFIRDQSSIFLAPENSGTDSAIKSKFLSKLIDKLGFGVSPSPAETNALIVQSQLFNKLELISFQSDTTANKAVELLRTILGNRLSGKYFSTKGGHLRPLGSLLTDQVFNPFDLLYGWLLYIARIDATSPKNLAPVFQDLPERDRELEDIINVN
jgi:hypothetical protein